MNPRIAAIIPAVLVSCLRLAAQTTAPPDVRIDLMPVCIGGNVVTYYATPGKVNKLEAYESAMGTPVFYKGSQTLRVYSSEAEAAPRGPNEAPAVPLATAVLPAGVRRALLLFASMPDRKLVMHAYPVDDKSLSAGDYRMFNLSPINVVGLMGRKRLELKPGQVVDVSEASMREKDVDLEVQLGCVLDGRQERFYSSVWGHSARTRNYVFMVGTGNQDCPVTLRRFHDIPGVESIGYEAEKTVSN